MADTNTNTPDWLERDALHGESERGESAAQAELESIPIIRTSDRQLFRRCRRKWYFMSKMREGLQPKESVSYFWAGSLGHFALEDYHGYNRYGDPLTAVEEAVKAQKAASTQNKHYLPPTWEEDKTIIEGCLSYYLEWLEYRDPLQTLWIDNKPQVEVRGQIPLIVNGQKVLYDFTADRIYITYDNHLGIQDYKFMKQFSSVHLDIDTQIAAYCWAASVLFQRPVTEFMYQQHLKTEIKLPRILKNGTISVNKQQKTTYIMYKKGLEQVYGSINAAPQQNKVFLNALIDKESEMQDAYIQRTRIEKNPEQCVAQANHILQEAADMIDPNTKIYPNPTRDCGWDCNILDLCVMMDDGSDWEPYMRSLMAPQAEIRDGWRSKLK